MISIFSSDVSVILLIYRLPDWTYLYVYNYCTCILILIFVLLPKCGAWNFLTLIIGSIVADHDENCLHFLSLLEIVDITFSPVIHVDDLGVLEGLVEEYLWNFTTIYPGRSVIPKMHYLVHYPAHIHRYGQVNIISSTLVLLLIIVNNNSKLNTPKR